VSLSASNVKFTLPDNFLSSLTCGCSLLLSGAIADIVGKRRVFLTGCLLFAVFMLGCGLSKNPTQLISFRACQGIAISLCLTTAVGIISQTFEAGPSRTFAFASLGAGQPLGYAIGLVLGGVFVDTIGWRYGYYIAAIANIIVFATALWGLPPDGRSDGNMFHRVITEVDWIGALTASISLGILLTVLA
jgi:MFS family permease